MMSAERDEQVAVDEAVETQIPVEPQEVEVELPVEPILPAHDWSTPKPDSSRRAYTAGTGYGRAGHLLSSVFQFGTPEDMERAVDMLRPLVTEILAR